MKKIVILAACFACFSIGAIAQEAKGSKPVQTGTATKATVTKSEVKPATATRPTGSSTATADPAVSRNTGSGDGSSNVGGRPKRAKSGKVSTAHMKAAKPATVSKPN